nr:VCBS repeat-containing protein [Nannocystis sp.]
MLFLAATAGACVTTVRTPLKQALPSVLGAEAAAPLCYGNAAQISPAPNNGDWSAVAGTLADVDGDGRVDLALMTNTATTTHSGHAVTFLINDGRGGLRATTGLKFPMTPTAIEAADLNADGLLDLAIAALPATGTRDDPAVHLLLGRGQGQFIAGAVATKLRPAGLWIADITGDGVLDLLVLAEGGGEVEVLRGDGRGEFSSIARSKLHGDARPEGLTLGDFDLDKRLDLATLSNRGGKDEAVVAVLRGDGKGEFKLASRRAIGRNGRALVAADFNGDGIADLTALADAAGSSANSPIAAVLLNDGALGFSAISYFGPDQVADAIVSDLDRNGAPDLLVASRQGSGASFRVLPGDGRGGFGPVVDVPSGNASHIARAADLDGDGRPELIFFGPQVAGVTILRPTPCR